MGRKPKKSLTMKITKFRFLLVLIGIGSFTFSWSQQSSHQYGSKNRNVYNLKEMPEIQKITERYYESGSLKISESAKINDREIAKFLKPDKNVTFELQRERKSRFEKDVVYRRYQQFYKGVKVDGGGYTVKVSTHDKFPHQLELLTPSIYYNLNVNVEPVVKLESIPRLIGIHAMSKYELLISNLYSEHYVLLWKINDQDQTGRQILINAHTGEIIKDEVSMPNISATVPFYGTFNLND